MADLIKKPAKQAVTPNLVDYETEYRAFRWGEHPMTGLPAGGINIAYEAVDRHLVDPARADKTAIRWLGKSGHAIDLTYRDLAEQSNKFANALQSLGIAKGDGVYALSSRVPELYVSVLGTLKHQAVFTPLFSAFGPEPIRARFEIGGGKVLLTNQMLYKRKVQPIRSELTTLEHVIILGDCDPALEAAGEVVSYNTLMEKAEKDYSIPATDPEDLALLHFTSGTTGKPKGAMHVHGAVQAHYHTGRFALDLHPDDIYWCTADPGWVTGTSYGIISPLTNGVTMIIDEGEFNAERWYEILQDQKVTVWYTAPTAVRMMMKAGEELVKTYDTSRLRFIASVGEPLNPEAVRWAMGAFELPIHDNWWQSETGGIMIANYAGMDIKPGSMGRPLPGIEAAIMKTDGDALREAGPGEEGELCLRPGWPSMFRGYLHNEQRYASAFRDGWYLSGDLAKRDEDGYFWFVGRSDDVIKSAGHLIGPFEVESALIEHEAVAEAAVIGIPDELLMEKVKAYVLLNAGFENNEATLKSIMAFVRKKLGPVVAPREIEICNDLPRTRSGKIMRRLLKARELGLPEGDTSTLETPEQK